MGFVWRGSDASSHVAGQEFLGAIWFHKVRGGQIMFRYGFNLGFGEAHDLLSAISIFFLLSGKQLFVQL